LNTSRVRRARGGNGGQPGGQPDDVGGKAEASRNARGKIAFERVLLGDVYDIRADGTGPIRLTDGPSMEGDPTWSPGGRKIAFASSRGRDEDIYTMNADGTGVVRLTDLPGMVGSPAWQLVD
jgi:hypothetical protein